MLYPAAFSNLFNLCKPPLLERDFIIIVHVVEGDDGTPVQLLQQPHYQISPYKPRTPGNQ